MAPVADSADSEAKTMPPQGSVAEVASASSRIMRAVASGEPRTRAASGASVAAEDSATPRTLDSETNRTRKIHKAQDLEEAEASLETTTIRATGLVEPIPPQDSASQTRTHLFPLDLPVQARDSAKALASG